MAASTPHLTSLKAQRWLMFVLVLALALRLLYGLSQDHLTPYQPLSHDSNWYLAEGYTLITNQQPSYATFHVAVSALPTAPLYLVYVGIWQALFSPVAAIIVIRIIQAVLSVATCYAAYRIAYRLSDDRRVGLVTALALAISPVFIIEAAQITTETLFIFFVAAGLSVYIEWIAQPERRTWRGLALTGMLLGLATLTRAVTLLFPLGIAIHLLLVGWRSQRQLWLKSASLLLVIYIGLASTWTIYNLARWNRFIIGAEGFASFLYVGAREEGWEEGVILDHSLEGVDIPDVIDPEGDFRIPDSAFVNNAARIIGDDPLAYVSRRVTDLLDAVLQPHGTVTFPGASLKQMAADWIAQDRSLAGLLDVIRGDYFWPKLIIYLFHYVGLIGGMIGMWLCRRRWQVALVPIGYIAYTLLIHLVLDAIPRYIFPTELFWWGCAAVALVALADRIRARRQQPGALGEMPSTDSAPQSPN